MDYCTVVEELDKTPVCDEDCDFYCWKFDEGTLESIRHSFLNCLTPSEQRIFVANNVTESAQEVFDFSLINGRTRLPVCKGFFLSVLHLEQSSLEDWVFNTHCGVIFKDCEESKEVNPSLIVLSERNNSSAYKQEIGELDPEIDDVDPLNMDKPVVADRPKDISEMIKLREISKITPRLMAPACQSKRCKSCRDFTDDQRALIFHRFWNVFNWKERKAFVLDHVSMRAPMRTTKPEGTSSRKYTYDYTLPFEDGKKIVCSVLFVGTLGIRINMVKRWIFKGQDDIEEVELDRLQEDPQYLMELKEKTSNKRLLNWSVLGKGLREKGHAYIGLSKAGDTRELKARPPRQMKESCDSSLCKRTDKRKCPDFTEEKRESIFKNFWQNMSWDERRIFVCNHIEEDVISRRRHVKKKDRLKGEPPKDSRRGATFRYYLDLDDQKVPVCKKMFLNTLGMGTKMAHCWTKKSDFGLIGSVNGVRLDTIKKRLKRNAKIEPNENSENGNISKRK